MWRRWIVLRGGSDLRWGGDLRRHHIFASLASREGATDVDGWAPVPVRATLPKGRRRPWVRRARIAAATMLPPEIIGLIGERAVPFAVDFHDDPILQTRTLGIEPEGGWLEREAERKRVNLAAFRRYVVPSLPLAELAGLELDRVIVAGNGTDPDTITVRPWPTTPAIGFISGASRGRGIETLIAAARMVRSQVPDVRLLLWLAATGDASAAYLADLRASLAGDDWIEFGSAPYSAMADQLGRATVHCIPNPPAAYWDSVSPVKLFDDMASGRPVVVTPRATMRVDVERHGAGLVATGDRPEDLADPLVRLLTDADLARRLGDHARRAAVVEHDWRLISADLAARLVRADRWL